MHYACQNKVIFHGSQYQMPCSILVVLSSIAAKLVKCFYVQAILTLKQHGVFVLNILIPFAEIYLKFINTSLLFPF